MPAKKTTARARSAPPPSRPSRTRAAPPRPAVRTPTPRESARVLKNHRRGAVTRLDDRAIGRMGAPELRRVLGNAVRMDGWISALTGAGTARDKKQYGHFVAPGINWSENLDLWRGDGLAGRIVELLPNEMMREGWELHIEGPDGPDIAKKVMKLLNDLCLNERVRHALCQERALGGSGIVMGIGDLAPTDDDEADVMSEELDLDTVHSFQWLETFEPIELFASKWQNDPSRPGFGRPEKYRLIPVSPGGAKKGMGVEIHKSRVLVFPGIFVSRRQITSQRGWGDAILTRCRETIRDFQTAWSAIGHLIAEYGVAVWKIKGLAEIISMDKDDELRTRVEMLQLAMSQVNAAIVDAELEDFDRKQVPLTGLSDVLREFGSRLAADADIPQTLLFGMSPGGMNATGEFDSKSWFDRVKAGWVHKVLPHLERAVRVGFRAIGVEEPENWSVRMRPLSQPSEAERIAMRLTQAQIDKIYGPVSAGGMGSLSADEVRQQRFGGSEFGFNTHVQGPAPVADAAASPQDQAAVDAQTAAGAAAAVGVPVPIPTPMATASGPREAFTGIQINSMMAIVQSVRDGKIDRDSGKAILMAGFPISDAEAEKVLGSIRKVA